MSDDLCSCQVKYVRYIIRPTSWVRILRPLTMPTGSSLVSMESTDRIVPRMMLILQQRTRHLSVDHSVGQYTWKLQ